ncbi:MAG: hypothetical protein AB7I50_06325 [Vicinamibacterales bacterium]
MQRTTFVTVWLLVIAGAGAVAQAPFPGAVFVNGGWVPCDHPLALANGSGCGATPGSAAPAVSQPSQPPPTDPPGAVRARTGVTYEHRDAGWQVYVMGLLQRRNGNIVMVAEVIRGADRLGRVLFEDGTIMQIAPTLNPTEWKVVP